MIQLMTVLCLSIASRPTSRLDNNGQEADLAPGRVAVGRIQCKTRVKIVKTLQPENQRSRFFRLDVVQAR